MMNFNRIKYILFDLDGTIIDTFDGVTRSVEYALKKFDINVEDRKTLLPFLGPPLLDSFMKHYNMSESEAELAVKYYREYYPEKGIFDCCLYDGIEQTLENLSKKYKLIIATSKPQHFAELIIEKFELGRYFYKIFGATLDRSVSEKSDIIAKLLVDFNISPSEAIMVGDRYYDTDGALANGLKSVGVTYGFGAKPELSAAFALVNSPAELWELFYNN